MYTQGILIVVVMQVLVRPIKKFMGSTKSIFVLNSTLQQSWESWAQTTDVVVDICGHKVRVPHLLGQILQMSKLQNCAISLEFPSLFETNFYICTELRR